MIMFFDFGAKSKKQEILEMTTLNIDVNNVVQKAFIGDDTIRTRPLYEESVPFTSTVPPESETKKLDKTPNNEEFIQGEILKLQKQIKLHPNIFLPNHLQTDKIRFPWKVWAPSEEIEALKVAFGFDIEECRICSELGNLDKLWLKRKGQAPVDIIFSKGKKFGIEAEAIWDMIRYMFNKSDEYYEEWDNNEDIKVLIHNYKQRMINTYKTPQLWLTKIFLLKYKKVPQGIIDDIISEFQLERKFGIKK